METTMVYWGYWDNGKENENYYYIYMYILGCYEFRVCMQLFPKIGVYG